MAQIAQALRGGRVETVFVVHDAGIPAPARRVAGRLRLLPIVEHAHQGLQVALRLHVATHHAEAHHRLSVLRQESRDDGVERALARAHQVVAAGVERETVAAVLQAQPVARDDHTRAEAHVVALDEADHHAAGVGRGQIDGAALRQVAGAEVLRATHIDQPCAAGQVVLVQHLRRRQSHAARLGHVSVDVGKGQLHGLDLQVLRCHAVHRQRSQVEVLQDAQRDLRGDALPVGRNLVQRVPPVVLRGRAHPLGPVGREIGLGHRPAMVPGMGRSGSRHLAAVEVLTLAARDHPQRARRVGKAETLTHLRLTAMRQEGLRETGLAGQFGQRCRSGPLVLHDHRHRITAFGHVDGRRQQVGEGQLAEAPTQFDPGRHGTGHRDRVPAALGRCLDVDAVLGTKVLGRPGLWCTSRRVQAVQFLAIPQNAERVRTQAVAAGFDDGHHRGGGDRRIDRIAAGLQHAQSGLRGQWV